MLGIGEIIFLICLVVLIFNIKRLPQIGASLRNTIKGFKHGIEGTEERRLRDVNKADEEDTDKKD